MDNTQTLTINDFDIVTDTLRTCKTPQFTVSIANHKEIDSKNPYLVFINTLNFDPNSHHSHRNSYDNTVICDLGNHSTLDNALKTANSYVFVS